MSWVGTGRLIFSHNYTDAEFEAVAARFLASATAMERDGWWFPALATDQRIRHRILREMLWAGWGARRNRARPASAQPAPVAAELVPGPGRR